MGHTHTYTEPQTVGEGARVDVSNTSVMHTSTFYSKWNSTQIFSRWNLLANDRLIKMDEQKNQDKTAQTARASATIEHIQIRNRANWELRTHVCLVARNDLSSHR